MKLKLLAISLAPLLVLSGCANVQGTTDISDITLSPGDNSTCVDSPCTVYFNMPEGKGKMVVREDGPAGIWKTGEYEAGAKGVFLGGYGTGLTIFTIEGSDAPPAYLTIFGWDG